MSSIYIKANKYLAISRVNVQAIHAHVISLFTRSLLVVMRIWILLYVYSAIYNTAQTEVINGLTLPVVIWSVTLAQSFQTATRPTIAELIASEIRSGTIAYSISRPYSYLLFYLSTFWGRLLPHLVVNLFLCVVTAYMLVGPISFSFTHILLSCFVLFLGYHLEFIMFLFIGLCAFWIEDIKPLLWNYNKIHLIFSGLILPVAFFPPSLKTITEYLPFTQTYYSAAYLATHFDVQLFWKYVSIQAGWLIILLPLVYFCLHKAIKNVSINGG